MATKKVFTDESLAVFVNEIKSYTDVLADGKSDINHFHDDLYYTESEIDTKVSEINSSIDGITGGTIIVGKANHAINSDNSKASESATKAEQDSEGNVIKDTYETKDGASSKLNEAKSYADSIKDDLLNGAGTAYDTLKELGNLIDDNTDAINALEIIAAGKAERAHTHSADDITSGALSSERLPIVPISKGGTGASTIENAKANLGIGVKVYAQNDEPTDAPIGSLWIDMDDTPVSDAGKAVATASMPLPSEENADTIYQYTGTDGEYDNGAYYLVEEDV